MRTGQDIRRGLTRALALVLTVMFALSTFHVHGGGPALDSVIATVVALDDGAQGADQSPDAPDRHAASDCPVCSVLSHLLGPGPTQVDDCCMGCRERFVLGRETMRAPPLYEHHRPPIARAV